MLSLTIAAIIISTACVFSVYILLKSTQQVRKQIDDLTKDIKKLSDEIAEQHAKQQELQNKYSALHKQVNPEKQPGFFTKTKSGIKNVFNKQPKTEQENK